MQNLVIKRHFIGTIWQNWCDFSMAKQSVKAGSRVVGRLKATMGKKGTILQVCGSGHKKRYVVQWNDGRSTTATAKGLQLDLHLKEAPVCSSSKRTRIDQVEEV